MYDLYICNKNYSSWSLRPWLMMRMRGIAFAERFVPFAPGAFDDVSPSGRVPCLIDGDGAGAIWDSLGIAEYLAERHGGVWPDSGAARAWARCAAAEMHSGFAALRERCPMNLGLRIRPDAVTGALARDLARLELLWRQGLERFGGPYLAGPAFTAVDAFYAPVAFRLMTYGLSLGPATDAYAARLRALPAMRDWYEAALAEPWRSPMHEAEARRAGTWLEDRRA